MTPERRAAIIEALVSDEESYFLGYNGMSGDPSREELAADITEEQIEAYDKFIREFPA